MKKTFIIFLSILFFLVFTRNTIAIYDPTSVPNNHFGIHVADAGNLSDVAKLINAKGGDWGYVTIVIQKGERNPNKWQGVFDEMRRLHIIPILRIATAGIPGNNNVWEKGNIDEIDGWVSFLNSLNWVIKNRYVIIGNEPNHANEWGGEVNPAEYADYLKTFSQKLKMSNDNFFIMSAGFDASAPTTRTLQADSSSMDESIYLEKMFLEDPNVFQYIDGWASHSYPNPDFSGDTKATGKGSVATFQWELNYLNFLGLKKNLPVFITETGWTHNSDTLTTNLGPKFEEAFQNIWNDKRVVAVTPFIYKYVNPPFDSFSWINKDGKHYDFYSNMENLSKTKGTPIQVENGDIITGIFPKLAVAGNPYNGILFVKNTGQSIWTKSSLTGIDSNGKKLNIDSMLPENVEPNQIGVFLIRGTFPASVSGIYSNNVSLVSNNFVITTPFEISVTLIPKLPNLSDIFNYLKIAIVRKIELFLKTI